MFKKYVSIMVCLTFVSGFAFAELSSKAKKAEKLAASGKIAEAMEIYKELMEKNAQKNADLVKEGREGTANCLLISVKEAFNAKKYSDSKSGAENILKDYNDTPSIKEASKYLILSVIETAKPMIEAEKYEDAVTLCNETKSKVSTDSEGMDKLNAVIGNAVFFQGKKALEAKDYKSAIAKLESVVNDYAGSEKLEAAKTALADALLASGLALVEQKNTEEALVVFNRIIKELPTNAEAVLKAKQEAAKLLIAKADENVNQKKYDEALKGYELALGVSTEKEGSARCKYAMGVCFSLTNQDDKAINVYKDVTTNFADTESAAKANAELYSVYLKGDNKQEALNSIKQAVLLSSNNSDYLFKLAQLQYSIGKLDDAQKAATKLLTMLGTEISKTYVNKEMLQYKLGQSYLILGRYTEAAVEFDKALTRNPNMLEAKKSLAFAQFHDKNFAGAIATYDALIKAVTSEFDDLNDKVAKDTTGEIAKKVEDLRKDIAYFHYQKGLSYEQLGDYDKAQAECRLGFEGVSTQEAAETLKRIQSAAQQKATPSVK